ncbi:hypothetical protein E2C01_083113 [Portunus trituberculatus]|uniref:Uncharacterized protein n=1 Tax=Portunus trituberculatus TaxID=210409 RepID=A0A5B7J0A5_PORTR|nr:hypothetical protein [Portunus trituberculatus]
MLLLCNVTRSKCITRLGRRCDINHSDTETVRVTGMKEVGVVLIGKQSSEESRRETLRGGDEMES